MRADLLMALCKVISPRSAVLVVLTSDYEAKGSEKGDGWGVTPRTLKGLQAYNPGINYKTLWRLVKEDLVECVGLSYRLKID
jgi:hypothetical protein